jgi:ParB-like chromosome segregation protein Spo0J
MDGTILAGHTRWKAARKMKLGTVPCRFMDIDGDKARLYRIADNKLSELAEWDMEMLERELEELSGKYRLELNDMGFDEEELLEHLNETFESEKTYRSGEIDPDSFDGFERQCPRCKFEWND